MSGLSDPPPLGLRSPTPAHGVPVTGQQAELDELEKRVTILAVQIDRLKQSSKTWHWVATTAAVFALGSALAVAKGVYGMGRDDQAIRSDVDQARRQVDENKADLRDLREKLYEHQSQHSSSRRFGVPSPASTPDKDVP